MKTPRIVNHQMIETQIGSRFVRPGVSDSDSASLQRGHGLNICCCRFKLVSVSPTRRKREQDEAIIAILPRAKHKLYSRGRKVTLLMKLLNL